MQRKKLEQKLKDLEAAATQIKAQLSALPDLNRDNFYSNACGSVWRTPGGTHLHLVAQIGYQFFNLISLCRGANRMCDTETYDSLVARLEGMEFVGYIDDMLASGASHE